MKTTDVQDDGLNRQRGRERRNQVTTARLAEPVHESVGELPDTGGEPVDDLRCERPVDQPPQPGVIRWVQPHERPRIGVQFGEDPDGHGRSSRARRQRGIMVGTAPSVVP
jgi:hypothetical protein